MKDKIYICNDCGNELLEHYCLDCKSNNVEEKYNKADDNKLGGKNE
jgi:hypothetical protein